MLVGFGQDRQRRQWDHRAIDVRFEKAASGKGGQFLFENPLFCRDDGSAQHDGLSGKLPLDMVDQGIGRQRQSGQAVCRAILFAVAR